MEKSKNFIIALVAILLLLLISLLKIKNLEKANKRLRNNQETLFDSARYYKISDSLNAMRTRELQLMNEELAKYYSDNIDIIKNMTKGAKLQTVETVKTENTQHINTILRDTIISVKIDTLYKDTTPTLYSDTVKVLDYKSYWTDIKGLIFSDSALLEIKNREELIITASRHKKKFLGIKLPIWLFGYKYDRLDAVSKNPNTIITDLQFINLQ